MTTPRITQLDPEDWKVNGDALIAWIDDTHFFDITPGNSDDGGHELQINDIATTASRRLGWHPRIAQAQLAARRHIGDE